MNLFSLIPKRQDDSFHSNYEYIKVMPMIQVFSLVTGQTGIAKAESSCPKQMASIPLKIPVPFL